MYILNRRRDSFIELVSFLERKILTEIKKSIYQVKTFQMIILFIFAENYDDNNKNGTSSSVRFKVNSY